MHTIKITPNLLFEYQCTSGKFIRLPNRIEKKRFSSEKGIKTFFARIGMLYCHPQTPFALALFKSRLGFPFWYWLTQVVLERGC